MSKLRIDAGRCIVRESDNAPLYTLRRIGSDSLGYTTTPTEADAFVHTLVNAINVHEGLVNALEAIEERLEDLASDHPSGRTLAYCTDMSDIAHEALAKVKTDPEPRTTKH